MSVPFSFIAMSKTQFAYPSRVFIQNPELTSHTQILLSQDPETKWSPEGVKEMEVTLCSCPFRVFKHTNFYIDQILMVRSFAQEASKVPLESKQI